MGNAIAIVGRPNVGKSTFFNRLVGRREAIMDDFSGVTRDRNYGYADWCGKYFSVIDTGGYVEGSEDVFEEEIRKQVKIAVDEASVIYFMVDINDGVTDLDRDFANFLRRTKKPVFIVANKADTPSKGNFAGEFYSLGMGDVYSVSSQNGSGTGELLDETIKHFQDEMPEDPYAGIPRIALVGRPNVGKSSLLNMLMGEERHIVTDVAGTTRDAIDSHYNAFGKEFILTDTAGIRKKGKVHEDIEFYSVMRSIKAIENSDICVILIDAQTGLESQDMNILALADKNKKGIVLIANKWDLVEKDHNTSKKFEEDIRKKTMPIDYYPIVFTSVLNKQRIFNVLEKVEEVYANKTKKIPTSALNDAMLREINNYPPPSTKGKFIKIKYVTQLPTPSPTFAFFCNLPQYISESYVRFLENKLRFHFGYEGVHIHVVFRKK